MPLESVKEMLNLVMQELDEFSEGAPLHKNGSVRNADSEIKHSTSSPTKYSPSPNRSCKVSEKRRVTLLQNVCSRCFKYCFIVIFSVFSQNTTSVGRRSKLLIENDLPTSGGH